MGKYKYFKGDLIGECTFIKDAVGDHQFRRSIFKCKCGNEFESEMQSVKRLKTRSCGCINLMKNPNYKHGFNKTKIYITWANMKRRCYYKNHVQYKDWGGRGIHVCNEWKYDFVTFLNYVYKLNNYDKKGYSIDRINNDGNYEPGNVRWATRKQQANNKRRK